MIRPILFALLIAAPATAKTLGPAKCAELTSAPLGQRITGRVMHIADGDTLDVGSRGACVRIRLTDFDAPERGEVGYDQSAWTLRRITAGKLLTCTVQRGRNGRTISYGRALAKCSTNGRGLGEQMRALGAPTGGR